MPKPKPIVAKTARELAAILGLSATEAGEWEVQHTLLTRLQEIVRKHKLTHAEIAKRSATSRTRVTAILTDALDQNTKRLLVETIFSGSTWSNTT